MPTAIAVKNVAKRFRLFDTPTQRLLEYVHPFGKRYSRDFWALDEVDFEVAKGETLGILGHNGSGKSTLLQIICGVLTPTRGEVKVDGRTAALLELGAGFNPEFTGRDNAEFFCLQNGLTKRETTERIREIEEFADIGEFFDRPMRLYSSGMFVRVAFAASISVDPEILVVDEALSVGDARFQNKCFQKFESFRRAGKTVVLVTHDTNAIVRHCDRAVLLQNGRVSATGLPKDVVNHYVDVVEDRSVGATETDLAEVEAGKPADGDALTRFLTECPAEDRCAANPTYNGNEHRSLPRGAQIVDYMLVHGGRFNPESIPSGSAISLMVKVRFDQTVAQPHFGFAIRTVEGVLLYGFNTAFRQQTFDPVEAGSVVVCRFDFDVQVHAGDLFVDLGVDEGTATGAYENLDRRNSVLVLNVTETERFDGYFNVRPDVQLLRMHGNEVDRKVA